MGNGDEIIEEIRKYDSEREWVEFKENWFKADELGEAFLFEVLWHGFLTISGVCDNKLPAAHSATQRF